MHEHLDVPISKERLHKLPVGACKTGMMDAKTKWQELLEVIRLDCLSHFPANFLRGTLFLHEFAERVVFLCHPSDFLASLCRLLARVHENEDLVLACLLHDFFIGNFVHELEALERLLFRDSDILLLQRHRPEAVVEIIQALLRRDAAQRRHVLVVGQRRGQAHNTHHFLRCLNLGDILKRELAIQLTIYNHYRSDA